MSLKDTFEKLKSTIIGINTSNIDSKLDDAIKDITSYRTQSGRNSYIDLVKQLISNSVDLDPSRLLSQQSGPPTPALYGQGNRLARYKMYESIVENIPYCFRALTVLVDNILSPDDITKRSLDIRPDSFEEDKSKIQSKQALVESSLKKLKLEKNLNIIYKNTLKFGDFFCEITDGKHALESKALLSESYYQNNITYMNEIPTNDKNIKIKLDYSSFIESENEKNKKQIEDITLVFHQPQHVVKLQSDLFPICFGYLVFPRTFINPAFQLADTTVNNICISIIKNLEKNVPRISDEFKNDKDLKDVISTMLKSADMTKIMNIRFVPTSKMQHFQVPSLKYYPYGESIFDSSQFNSKMLIALETALTIARLSRSTEKRKVMVEIGLPRDARKQIETLKEEFKKRKVSIDSFGTLDTISCLDLNTKIKLSFGKSLTISEIIDQFEKGKKMEVYAYDHKSGKIVPDRIINAKITGRNVKVVKVTLDNGETELCTPEHLWMMRDGSYKQAKNLLPGDSLMPLYTKSAGSTNNKGCTYELLYHPGYKKWELTHRSFTKYLGLVIDGRCDIVHHIDKNPRNNCLENLYVCSRKEHAKIHSKDMDNGWNGANKGNSIPDKEVKCKICGKIFLKPWNIPNCVCSKECLNIYKKEYSISSWEKRKDKNEYKLIDVKCVICEKDIRITKSKYNRIVSRDFSYFCCDNKECIDKCTKMKKTNKSKLQRIKKNCIICGKEFNTIITDLNKQACSIKCSNAILAQRKRDKISTMKKSNCSLCGKDIIVSERRLSIVKFHPCKNKDCKKYCASQNIKESKRKWLPGDEEGFCIICGKEVIFNPRIPGYYYFTCGSKSCSHKAMHKGIIRETKFEGGKIINHKVISVEDVDFTIDVGDIETQNFHNFSLDSGAIVHNSSISTFEDLFLPMKDGKPFVDVDTFTGGNMDVRSKTEELKFVRDTIISGLNIPPSFLGVEENNSTKANLSEESILFARAVVSHQQYLTTQTNDLIKKVFDITNPEESLTILDNIIITLPSPKSLHFEMMSRHINEIVTLIENLERLGIPKEYTKKKYLPDMDWEDIENYLTSDKTEKKLGLKRDEYDVNPMMGGMGMGAGMPPVV